MKISIIKENEIEEVSKLIEKTARICFVDYYPQKEIDKVCESLNYEGVKKRASWTHFYVIKEENKIIACGAIGPYWQSGSTKIVNKLLSVSLPQYGPIAPQAIILFSSLIT